MFCLPPIVITPSMVVSSSITEPDITLTIPEAEWISGAAVTKNQQVIRASLHRKYRAVDNIIATDNLVSPESSPNLWQDIGATNKYAMFELDRNNSSFSDDEIIVTVNPMERISSIFLGGLKGSDVKIEMLNSSDVVVKTYNYNLKTRNTISWKTYFFGKFETTPSITNFNLPLIYQGKIRVTITNSSTGGVALSSLVVGTAIYMGEIQWEPESDSQNFSKIERSFDGTLTGGVSLIKRRTVPTLSATLWAPKNITNILRKLRTDINAVPAVWSGLDQDSTDPYYEALLIFGIYRQFKINIKRTDFTVVSLNLEEM